jgi:ABC-type multidrug transport system fused ATPase/permease subunit
MCYCRWVFEALYGWYFNNKEDGLTYLENYKYDTFDRSHIFEIQTNFLIAMNVITLFFLLPEPLFLGRTPLVEPRHNRADRSSMQSNDSSYDGDHANPPPRLSQRESEAVQPIMFMRESTVTGRTSKLSVNLSQMGEENTSRGPTVMLKDVTYRVRDVTSPVGYKTVLNRISGQFDWGKLNMILGAPQCGKSSLMNIIAGNLGAGTEVGGTITFNGQEKLDVPLWERCGFVPMQNEHIRDLTVREVLTFAMKLRCYNHLGFAVLAENVKVTIENLHLTE